MKRIVLYVLGGLAALIAVLGISGYALSPEFTADVSVEIAKPPDLVFSVVSDIGQLFKWSSEFIEEAKKGAKLDKISDNPERWAVRGGSMYSEWFVDSKDSASHHMTSRMQAPAWGVEGAWDLTVAPSAKGSLVRSKMRMKRMFTSDPLS